MAPGFNGVVNDVQSHGRVYDEDKEHRHNHRPFLFLFPRPAPVRDTIGKPSNRQRDLDLILLIPPFLSFLGPFSLQDFLLDPLPQPDAVGVQVRVRFQECVQLCDVAALHVGALLVQVREDAGDVGVGEGVCAGEEFAADQGVEVVAAVPEGPFAAEVRGDRDGGGGLAVGICLWGFGAVLMFWFFWFVVVDWGEGGVGECDKPGISNGIVRARFWWRFFWLYLVDVVDERSLKKREWLVL